MRNSIILSLAALILAITGIPVSADTLFTYDPGQPASIIDQGFFNIGNEFTVGSTNLSVTQIGAFVNASDITAGNVTNTAFTASIYSKTGGDTGSLLSTTLIPVGSPVDAQHFAYTPLTFTLNANTNYVVTDFRGTPQTPGGTTPFGYSGGAAPAGTFGAGTTFVKNRYNSSADPNVFPDQSNGCCSQFMGGNLQYTVPEPASVCLLGAGLLVPLLARRRRN